jgi:hypothetical protein
MRKKNVVFYFSILKITLGLKEHNKREQREVCQPTRN